MRIIRATDAIPVEHPVFMVFGQPGIGKSSLAYSCKDVLVLRGGWLEKYGRYPKSLLRNNGNGSFTDVTFAAGLARVHFPTQTASWGDYDNDGDLDLYVGNESSASIGAQSTAPAGKVFAGLGALPLPPDEAISASASHWVKPMLWSGQFIRRHKATKTSRTK